MCKSKVTTLWYLKTHVHKQTNKHAHAHTYTCTKGTTHQTPDGDVQVVGEDQNNVRSPG